jgi:hypothetical protein
MSSEEHRQMLLGMGVAGSASGFMSGEVQRACYSCSEYSFCDRTLILKYKGEPPCDHRICRACGYHSCKCEVAS